MASSPTAVADGAVEVGGGVLSVFGCPAADQLGRGLGTVGSAAGWSRSAAAASRTSASRSPSLFGGPVGPGLLVTHVGCGVVGLGCMVATGVGAVVTLTLCGATGLAVVPVTPPTASHGGMGSHLSMSVADVTMRVSSATSSSLALGA